MKYILTLENFETYGFRELPLDELNKWVYGNDYVDEYIYRWVEPNKEEIELVSSFFKCNPKSSMILQKSKRGTIMTSSLGYQYQLTHGDLSSVIKVDDDWYIVYIVSSGHIGSIGNKVNAYLCDQIYGLKNCLNKKVKNHI